MRYRLILLASEQFQTPVKILALSVGTIGMVAQITNMQFQPMKNTKIKLTRTLNQSRSTSSVAQRKTQNFSLRFTLILTADI